MPRAGLSAERVVIEAAALADEVGLGRLTLAALAARLGVRQPSLYKHVESLEAVQQAISVLAKTELAEAMGRAAIGIAGDRALIAIAHAYRQWAAERPGRYEAVQRPPVPGDAEDEAASARAVEVIATVVSGYGLDEEATIDAIRAFRSALHGFVALEASGGFALPASVDRSFDRLLRALIVALGSWWELGD